MRLSRFLTPNQLVHSHTNKITNPYQRIKGECTRDRGNFVVAVTEISLYSKKVSDKKTAVSPKEVQFFTLPKSKRSSDFFINPT